VQTPPPVTTIMNEEELLSAMRRIPELTDAKKGSIEEAVRISLQRAVEVWKAHRRDALAGDMGGR
jgi:hypothetical protein